MITSNDVIHLTYMIAEKKMKNLFWFKNNNSVQIFKIFLVIIILIWYKNHAFTFLLLCWIQNLESNVFDTRGHSKVTYYCQGGL